MALYFECRINKNAFLQIAFFVILPTGIMVQNIYNVWAKLRKKQAEGVLFVNSALKIHCQIDKNTLLQTAFSGLITLL